MERYEGMRLELPNERPMKGVYRSGILLVLCNTQKEAEEYLARNSSPQAIEDHGLQFRIVPVDVVISLHAKG